MRTREKEDALMQQISVVRPCREIICSGGEIAFCDDEDYPVVSRHSWVYTRGQNRPYVVTTLNTAEGSKKTIMMHNMILGFSKYLDHHDGNTLNNQKYNLRPATHQENGWNKGKPSGCRHGKMTSKYKGVSRVVKETTSYWLVLIKLTKKSVKPAKYYRKGGFQTELEAAKHYNEKIVEFRGKFAWINPL